MAIMNVERHVMQARVNRGQPDVDHARAANRRGRGDPYRYKILRGRIAERARDLIRQICQSRDVVIVRGAVSPDHIHLLLSAPPHLAPTKLTQYLKGRSWLRLQEEFPELRKRYSGQHLWARGYFCATVGAVDETTIKAYIENQKWDADEQGFKIIAPTEP